jgi:ABC-type uncharacterized transport system fused permease/ATPase subunit
MTTDKRGVVRDASSIVRTYWASEEKWSVWGFLLAVVAFNLGTVCTSVGINAWNRGFYNALQAFDRGILDRPSHSEIIQRVRTRNRQADRRAIMRKQYVSSSSKALWRLIAPS